VKTSVVATREAARKTTGWGWLAWAVSGEAGNCETMTLGRVCIRSGCENPRHRHGNCDELLYLLSGALDHHADDVGTLRMTAGDVIVIPAGVSHNARSVGGEDAEMIVVYSAARREFEEIAGATR